MLPLLTRVQQAWHSFCEPVIVFSTTNWHQITDPDAGQQPVRLPQRESPALFLNLPLKIQSKHGHFIQIYQNRSY
jgi:hypothetical protein